MADLPPVLGQLTDPKPEVKLYNLVELAKMHNQLAPVTVDGGAFFAKHRVADTLHGWSQYEYHQARKVLLTVEDYKKALEDHTAKDGNYQVHEPAVRKIEEKHDTNVQDDKAKAEAEAKAKAEAEAKAKAESEKAGVSQ